MKNIICFVYVQLTLRSFFPVKRKVHSSSHSRDGTKHLDTQHGTACSRRIKQWKWEGINLEKEQQARRSISFRHSKTSKYQMKAGQDIQAVRNIRAAIFQHSLKFQSLLDFQNSLSVLRMNFIHRNNLNISPRSILKPHSSFSPSSPTSSLHLNTDHFILCRHPEQ